MRALRLCSALVALSAMVGLSLPSVAYADSGTIHVNCEYVSELHKQLPEDYLAMMIHELTHVVQQYPNDNKNQWLTEGIADYVRHKYFEKDIEPKLHLDKDGQLQGFARERNKGNFATKGYLAGYTVTGAFLYWLEGRKDKDIVFVLNRAMRDHRYDAKVFEQRCKARLGVLWQEFVAQSGG